MARCPGCCNRPPANKAAALAVGDGSSSKTPCVDGGRRSGREPLECASLLALSQGRTGKVRPPPSLPAGAPAGRCRLEAGAPAVEEVAQASSLPPACRASLGTGRGRGFPTRHRCPRPPAGSRRYGRLPICATPAQQRPADGGPRSIAARSRPEPGGHFLISDPGPGIGPQPGCRPQKIGHFFVDTTRRAITLRPLATMSEALTALCRLLSPSRVRCGVVVG